MPKFHRAAAWLSIGSLLLACAAPAFAAPSTVTGTFPTFGANDNGTTFVPIPSVTMGRDSSSGLPCWVGTTSTCGTGSSSGGSAPYAYTPVAGGQYGLTVASATSLTVPTGALFAFVQAVNSCVNWRPSSDGAPTTTVGQSLCPGALMLLSGTFLTTAEFIVQGSPGTAPVLNVGYAK